MDSDFIFSFRDSDSFLEYLRLNYDLFVADNSTLLITFDGNDIFQVIVSEFDV